MDREENFLLNPLEKNYPEACLKLQIDGKDNLNWYSQKLVQYF
jgi:hypothetical protein